MRMPQSFNFDETGHHDRMIMCLMLPATHRTHFLQCLAVDVAGVDGAVLYMLTVFVPLKHLELAESFSIKHGLGIEHVRND